MGGREGDEEEMGYPLHILAQIISEQLRSAAISHRRAEAVCAEGDSGETRIIHERQMGLAVNLWRVLQGG